MGKKTSRFTKPIEKTSTFDANMAIINRLIYL